MQAALASDTAVGAIVSEQRSASDTVDATDTTAAIRAFARNALDVVQGSDSAVRGQVFVRLATDLAPVVEALVRLVTFTRGNTEVAVVTDAAIAQVLAHNYYVTDTALATDVATRVYVGGPSCIIATDELEFTLTTSTGAEVTVTAKDVVASTIEATDRSPCE